MGIDRPRVAASVSIDQLRYLRRWTGSSQRDRTDRAREIRVQLLGDFRVWVGSRCIEAEDWYLRKPKSLVQLLALTADHRLERKELVQLLWSGMDPQRGTQMLEKAVFLAQRVFQPELSPTASSTYLHLEGEWVILDPPGGLWVDVEAFRQSAQRAHMTQDHGDHDRALCLYRGDLLPDDRCEDWTVEPREELRAIRQTLLSPGLGRDEPRTAIVSLEHVRPSNNCREVAPRRR